VPSEEATHEADTNCDDIPSEVLVATQPAASGQPVGAMDGAPLQPKDHNGAFLESLGKSRRNSWPPPNSMAEEDALEPEITRNGRRVHSVHSEAEVAYAGDSSGSSRKLEPARPRGSPISVLRSIRSSRRVVPT
jgi:hypothetical protein